MFRRIQPSVLSAARCMSTSAKHDPPKKLYGVNGRYAMATFTAASKANLLPKVEGELNAFVEILKKHQGVAAFFGNPTIARSEKAARVASLFDEKTFSHISRNLLLTLAANGRIGESEKIIQAFDELMQASRGSVNVVIISAEALKKKQLETIQQAVASFVGAGKAMDVQVKVDESLLGGLQVQINDKFLDLSVASRISSLSQALDAAH